MGWGSAVAAFFEGFKEVFKWRTSESGYLESKRRKEGERLEAYATSALHAWKLNPTKENWKAYLDAVNALRDWSNTP